MNECLGHFRHSIQLSRMCFMLEITDITDWSRGRHVAEQGPSPSPVKQQEYNLILATVHGLGSYMRDPSCLPPAENSISVREAYKGESFSEGSSISTKLGQVLTVPVILAGILNQLGDCTASSLFTWDTLLPCTQGRWHSRKLHTSFGIGIDVSIVGACEGVRGARYRSRDLLQ